MLEDQKPEENINSLSINKFDKTQNSDDNINIENIENKYLNKPKDAQKNDKTNYSIIKNIENNDRKNIETVFGLERLAGLQKKALLLIYDHCNENGDKTTRPLGINYFVDRIKTTQMNAHNVLNELIKKKVIERVDYQRGRGGWSKYVINEKIWDEIKINELKYRINIDKTIDKTIETGANSSSKEFNNKNTTTEETEKIQIPQSLTKIVSHRELTSILSKGLLSVDEIVESLEHFAFDYERNLVKSKTSPVNLLFGLMRSSRQYRSVQKIKDETTELEEYLKEVQQAENHQKMVKQELLKVKFEEFKKTNPKFVEKVRKEQKFAVSDEIVEQIAFETFLNEQNSV